MPTVIKRDGREELYDREKLRTSLRNTSDDLLQPLSNRDIDSIIFEVESVFKGSKKVHSQHIYYVVVGVLYAEQFHDMVKGYTSHITNAYKA